MKIFRRKYFQAVSAIWLYFDKVMDGFGENKSKFKFDGTKNKYKDKIRLSDEHLEELWQGIAANLPPDMSVEDARSIVDPDDVRHMRFPVPTQYQGTALQRKLTADKSVSSGKEVNEHHGKFFA